MSIDRNLFLNFIVLIKLANVVKKTMIPLITKYLTGTTNIVLFESNSMERSFVLEILRFIFLHDTFPWDIC